MRRYISNDVYKIDETEDTITCSGRYYTKVSINVFDLKQQKICSTFNNKKKKINKNRVDFKIKFYFNLRLEYWHLDWWHFLIKVDFYKL